MRKLLALAILAFASCADDKPVPPSVRMEEPKPIAPLDLSKVGRSGDDVASAADRVAEANAKAQSTTQKLLATMERARAFEQGSEMFRKAWEESEAFAAQLGENLTAVEKENDTLKTSVATLTLDLAVANAQNTDRDILIGQQFEGLSRAFEDIKSLNGVRDDLVASRAATKIADKRKHELLIESGKKSFLIGWLIAGCTALGILAGYLAVRRLLP